MGRLFIVDNSSPGCPKGYLKAQFDESIKIEPNSKIGLINCSLAPDDILEIIVLKEGDLNPALYFSTSEFLDGRVVEIEHGTYKNKKDFLSMVEERMNAGLRYEDSERGFQWQVRGRDDKNAIDGKYMDISFNRNTYQEPTPIDTNVVENLMYDPNTYTYTNTNVDDGYSAYLTSVRYFCNGTGELSCQRNGEVDTRCFIGLNTKNVIDDDELLPENCYVALECDVTYTIWINGVSTDTEVVYEANDIFGIKLDEGSLIFYYNRTGDDVALGDQTFFEYKWLSGYYAVCGIYRAGGSLKNIEYHYDPFDEVTPEGRRYHSGIKNLDYNMGKKLDQSHYNLGLTPQEPQITTLGSSSTLRELFGFGPEYPILEPCIFGNFEAEDTYYSLNEPFEVIVELTNLPLESYDCYTKRRKSVLYYFVNPNFEHRNGRLRLDYTTNFPIMMDIKNKIELNLNEIIIRITDGTVDILSLTSKKVDKQGRISSLSVIITGPDEN